MELETLVNSLRELAFTLSGYKEFPPCEIEMLHEAADRLTATTKQAEIPDAVLRSNSR